ncbi:Aminopeptidase E [termite gut metagenome]|uniref:Aminopeptidase E n=1 Tax=termite gut metagenome TaxID=433724 RepID=A0A5J4RZI1_9ZZZZ
MKRILTVFVFSVLYYNIIAQENFVFTKIKENPITSIKNQNRSGTCWSFSTLGLLESELLRTGKGEYDLSEMFVVHHTMVDRAEHYVRLHGGNSFAPGGVFHDVLYCLKHYGLVPQEIMPGIMYGDTLPVHAELDAVAGAYVNAIAKGSFKKLTPVWKQGLCAIYDTYLGKYPEKFVYKGNEYTPMTFAQSLGLNPDNYVSLTSYTHHPFYSKFAIEIQDNWRNSDSWNLPLDELMTVIDHATEAGFTVAWASDVSEEGFNRNGTAVVSDTNIKHDIEKEITQEMRQTAFDNWESTDDHGMLIYGIAEDETGEKYYMVKNSWGTKNKYNGTWYASKAFLKYKTINILVHKDGIPKNIAKKLNL